MWRGSRCRISQSCTCFPAVSAANYIVVEFAGCRGLRWTASRSQGEIVIRSFVPKIGFALLIGLGTSVATAWAMPVSAELVDLKDESIRLVDAAEMPVPDGFGPLTPKMHQAPLPTGVLAGIALLSVTAAHNFGRRPRRRR